ncbi:uncharacterized protein LOC117977447 isoform X1 [Pan paniscus]|uniref:uncharacterized protein LOC117977447 isoform X1 n=1 Tax=Pan paniscus TaxID=9597 RepID=UPI00155FC51E|nr:uncharacterized protein LOC117977447 isoform X1 [Pan paniscus]
MAAPLACGSPCLLGGRVRARNPGGVRTKGREKLREASLPPPSPPPPLRARSSSFKPGWPEWSQLSPGSRRARKWPRGRSHSPQTNEFKGATEEAPAKESPHTGEFKGAALVSPISKRPLRGGTAPEYSTQASSAAHRRFSLGLDAVAHTCNPSTLGGRGGQII